LGEKQENMRLSGGAWFDIRHSSARPLTIEAGELKISDIGTRFDVQSNGRQVRVAVAEGEVEITSSVLAQPVRLSHSRGLLFDGAGGTAVASDLAIDAMGPWRSGHLSYQGTPLSLVAADLSRYAGISVDVAPALRDREFSGTFVIGNGETGLRDLAQLMGLELSNRHGGYVLDERRR
jgi:transmembrane sensor